MSVHVCCDFNQSCVQVLIILTLKALKSVTGPRPARSELRSPKCSARGEGIPPVSDASFTKETHTRSLTQLSILENMRQWTEASQTNSELRSRHWRSKRKNKPPRKYPSYFSRIPLLRYISSVLRARRSQRNFSFSLPYPDTTPPRAQVATPRLWRRLFRWCWKAVAVLHSAIEVSHL